MIVLLYGPDDLRRLRRKKEFVAAFKEEHSDLGIGYFDGGSEGESEKFAAFARGRSLFESAKLAVVDGAFEMDAEPFAAELKALAHAKDVTVVLSEPAKPPKTLSFLLKDPVRAEEFARLEGAELAAFVRGEAEALGVAMAPDAVRFLCGVYGGDSWALATELRKIASLSGVRDASGGAAAATVDMKTLQGLGLEAAPDYWALVNGLKSIDGRIRIAALERLIAINEPAAKIFNMLAAQAGEKAPRMAEFDLAVKSGKLDYEEALLDLVLAA